MIRDAHDFGQAIRRARKERGLTQTQLAERCGVNLSFVSELEIGKPTAQLGKALVVAMELGFAFPSEPGIPRAEPTGDRVVLDDPDEDLSHLPRF